MRARLWLPLAGALALVLWLALGPEGGGDRAVALPPPDAAAGGASRPSQLAAGGVELDQLEGERTLAGSAAPGVGPNAPTPNTPGALLAGRVLFPADAPPDETLPVVAFAAKPRELEPYLFLDQVRLGTAFAPAVPFAVAPVAAGGAFALELAEPRAELWLQVDGRFLALAQPVPLALPADGEILLRPALGAWIHGAVAGAGDGQPVVLGADLAGSPPDPERMRDEPLRVAFADAAGRYELRGVPAGGTWWIGTRAEGTALDHRRGLATVRGGTLEIDLASVPGAAVSGRVLHAAAPEEGVAGVLTSASPAAADELLGVAYLAPVAITEDGGAFTLAGVALGASRIEAWEGLCTAEPLELEVRGDVADLVFALDAKSALTGRVLLPDRSPARVLVHVRAGRGWRTVPSGADGSFRLACLEPGGTLELSAFVAAAVAGAQGLYAEATAVAGEHVELVLAPNAASPVTQRTAPTLTTGRVLAPDGAPVSGAEVYVGDVGDVGPELDLSWLGGGSQARTDALGRFVVTGWTAAGLGVVARARGFAPSAIVPIDSGENLDVVLRAGGGLFGTVYDEAGEAQPRFVVYAFHRDGADAAMASTDANGTFRFDALLPGNYVLGASPIPAVGANGWDAVQRDRSQRERRAFAVVVAGVDTRADVGAPPPEPVRVVGRVTAAGAPVRAQLVFIADGAAPLSDARKCMTDADGWYAVELGPGPHRRAVVVPGERGVRVAFDRIDVPRVAEHRLDLELPVGRIRGRLLSGDVAVEGTEVVAWRLDAPDADAFALGAADAGGDFALAGLAPGRYQVLVDQRVADLAFRPVEVELAAGAEVEVELRGEPAGALRVAAVDAAGAPFAGARIGVAGADGVLAARETTRADGTRLVRSLAPGTRRVFLSTPELATQGTFEVVAGAETEARLVLAPAGRLRVEVVDRGGAPAAAKVTLTGGALPPALPDFDALLEGADPIDFSAVLVGPLPPGRYDVTATAADGRTAARSVLVTAEGEHRVRLRLRE